MWFVLIRLFLFIFYNFEEEINYNFDIFKIRTKNFILFLSTSMQKIFYNYTSFHSFPFNSIILIVLIDIKIILLIIFYVFSLCIIIFLVANNNFTKQKNIWIYFVYNYICLCIFIYTYLCINIYTYIHIYIFLHENFFRVVCCILE